MLGAVMRLSHLLLAAAALEVLVAAASVLAETPWGAPDQGYATDEGYPAEGPHEPENAPDPDQYRENLAPYGEWQDLPDYGVVWRPTYVSGWQPYVDGYWAWTASGWTWVSYEPWAWTLHYGRWVTLPAYGWVWVPGTIWGPAWVDWYWGAGWVGWAPLSPFGHLTAINSFVFVNERDFCSHDVRRHVVHHRRVSDRVRRDWNDRSHRRAPGRERIERVSRHTVTRLGDRPRNTLAPRRGRRTLQPEPTRARHSGAAPPHDREVRGDARRSRPEVRPEAVAHSGPDDPRRVDTRLRERRSWFDNDDARIRGPRFERDEVGQVRVRPHAWTMGGGASRVRNDTSPMSESRARRAGAGRRQDGGGGRVRGGAAGMGMGTGMGGASPAAR